MPVITDYTKGIQPHPVPKPDKFSDTVRRVDEDVFTGDAANSDPANIYIDSDGIPTINEIPSHLHHHHGHAQDAAHHPTFGHIARREAVTPGQMEAMQTVEHVMLAILGVSAFLLLINCIRLGHKLKRRRHAESQLREVRRKNDELIKKMQHFRMYSHSMAMMERVDSQKTVVDALAGNLGPGGAGGGGGGGGGLQRQDFTQHQGQPQQHCFDHQPLPSSPPISYSPSTSSQERTNRHHQDPERQVKRKKGRKMRENQRVKEPKGPSQEDLDWAAASRYAQGGNVSEFSTIDTRGFTTIPLRTPT